MALPMNVTHSYARNPLAALGQVTVAALTAIAIMCMYFQVVLLKQIVMPLPILAGIALVLAVLIQWNDG